MIILRDFYNTVDENVQLLIDELGIPDTNSAIQYEELEDILSLDRDSARYRTIIHAWRLRLYREHNLHLICLHRIGYRGALPGERLSWSVKRIAQSNRMYQKAVDVCDTTTPVGLQKEERSLRKRILENYQRNRFSLFDDMGRKAG